MIFDIVMPKMGESLTEGTVLEWKKRVGESIEKDEILLEIATDKVDSEIPSPVSGTLVEIIGEVNKTYDVDAVIARVETSQISVSVPSQAVSPAVPETTSDPNKQSLRSVQPAVVSLGDDRYYSPLVRAVALEEGINPQELQRIPGTGFRGRVSKKDVLFYVETRGSGKPSTSKLALGLEPTGLAQRVDPTAVEITEMDSMRKSIAKHMRQSLDTSAHVYCMSEADMTGIMTFIGDNNQRFKEHTGHSLTVTHFIALAVRDALLAFPLLNSSLDGTRIIRHKHLNVGIAVAVGNGLVVPPVRNAEDKTLLEISTAIAEIVVKAREKKLSLENLEGSTFSITNFGVFGNIAGFPVINQPNVAILGVGAIKKRPVVMETDQGDEIVIRHMCIFTLGFDHRLIDGAMGGQFVEAVAKNLERVDPARELKDLLDA